MNNQFSRREALSAAGLAAAGLILPLPVSGAISSRFFRAQAPRRSIRLAHLTDIHVQPELKADQGFAACLDHAQSLGDKPQLILTGGDSVMDCFDAGADRTKVQWDIWKKTLKDNCSIPVESSVGNHDVWGWNKAKSKTTGDEPLYGKKMAEEMFGANRYRSFDKAGWHFVVLDSIFPSGESYLGKLDDEQFEWLAGDLASTNPKTPVLVLSHIPIVSVTAFFFSEKYKDNHHQVPGSWMHEDAYRLTALFSKHKNVKAALSGHMHLVDRCEYNGVTYLCDGAVCGNWWKGRHKECDEGYAMVDLFEDGTVAREYHTYGWKAVKEAPKEAPSKPPAPTAVPAEN